MRVAFQLATRVVAAAALLFGTASQATGLSELPLKASIFAKPNVIFGMDDSGSMDSELMLYNNDGAFWWDFNASSGWGVDAAHPNAALRTITSSWFNAVGDASSRWRKMVYLFPNGTGAGKRIYADAQNDHFAIMPTTQFAFLRWSGVYFDSAAGKYLAAPSNPALSPVHNPLYYNPMVTYSPWARAQLSTGPVTPVDATATAAKSHPVNGTYTFNLTTDIARDTGSNLVFTAFPGMRVPSGARKNVCSAINDACPGWVDVTADENAAAGSVTRVAMAYYPATYWVKETCTPENTSLTADTCTTAPDGSTLKRYEIKSTVTSYPSGRDYAAEMQNFANWFQYFRKRRMMLAAAMGETMENITGMRIGVVPFNAHPSPTTSLEMFDADSTISGGAQGRKRVAGFFYQAEGSGGTPTRETLKYIGEQFKRTDKTAGRYNMVEYSCQRNNAFIVTDGFANASTPSMPAWDSGKTAADWGGGVPYATTYDNTLADIALRYFTNNPRPPAATDGLTAGALPKTTVDLNDNLHMNTYGLTLGARGTLFLGESSPRPTSAGDWPNPTANRSPTSVDDLWHATINGRGKMYLANTPEETAARVESGLSDILDQAAAQGGIAVSAVNLDRSDGQAYLGVYNRLRWQGDLTANAIDRTTAVVSTTSTWSAATMLRSRDWSTRVIFTAVGGSGEDFAETTVGATVNPDTSEFPSNQPVVDYLRGNRAGEGTIFRSRASLIGAVVNAEPVLARDPGEQMVYIASGEGMLHALDTATGSEHWAFVPPDTLTNMGKSVQRGWVYQTLLDATPAYARLSNDRKMLIGGMGAAGRAYYALDVTSPRNLTTAQAKAQFKWTFPASTDPTNQARMGYTVAKPVIARVLVSGVLTDVVLVTSGYDNGLAIGDGKGRLWMLNATTGAVIKTFRTTAGAPAPGAEAGLAHISAFREADGSTQYVYGGDLLGNLWRFDLALAGSAIDAEVLATLRDSSGNVQPVTAAPELALIEGRRVVMIGTGRILDITDFGKSDVHSFYVIADGSTLTNARTVLTSRTFTRGGTPEELTGGTAMDWSASRGWYFDLPVGENANTDPVVVYGAVAFVTNFHGASNCAQFSYLYLVDIKTGARVTTSTFVSQTIAVDATSSRVIALRVENGRIFGTTHRSDNSVFKQELPVGQTILPAKNAWREIRR